MNHRFFLVVTGLALLANAACGGDDPPESDATAPVETATSAPAADGTVEPLSDDRTRDLGREVAELIAEGDADVLWEMFDDALRDVIGSEEEGAAFLDGFRETYGAQGDRQSEVAERIDDYSMYRASFAYENADEPVNLTVGFNDDESVAELSLEPTGPAPSVYLDYQTQAPLRLPFDGDWYVFWGGRNEEQNYHVISVDQRFAYDIVINRDGSSHEGEGTANEDYYCYGEPVLAPAGGSVIQVIDGVADNIPGEANPAEPTGNTVVIDHGRSEYSVMAHLKPGSVAVAEGDTVVGGEQVGECGNTGNSSEPHLHYHLQDGPVLFDAGGLPAFFNEYIADGQPVARGEPVGGQAVRNP